MTETPNLAASGAKEIAEQLAVIFGGQILDVCTGKGEFIETLMKTLGSCDSFVGVDLESKDLDHAREAFEDQSFRFLEMDAANLDFADASFDSVCIAHSLHHLADVPRVLKEMKRVLKPSGYFILEENYQDGEQSEAQQTGTLEHHWTAKIERAQGLIHNETLMRNQIVEYLQALRLANLEIFDSSRNVKCFFCDQRFECEDPKSESLIEFFINGIDKTLQGLTTREKTSEIVAEAEQLKLRVHETGFAEASLIFAIGIK
ncbi:MAG: class I SAM-dependent methyltransferase [Candidatus Hermodarchaeia archaeon]